MSYLLAYNPYNTNLFMKTRSIDPAAQDFIDAAGITGDVQQQAINNLVKGLKADGIWSKMKAVYPFVTDNYNVFSYTDDFSNGYWAKTNATVTSDTITNPFNQNTGDTITDNTTNGQHKVQTGDITTVIGSGNTFTVSAYLRAGTATRACIYAYGTSKGVGVDLTNGTQIAVTGLTNASAGDVSIVNVGNGWYRVSMTGVVSGVFSIAIMMISGNDFSYAGTGTSLYLSSAQLQLGSTATTYQPIATTQQAYISAQFKYNLKDPRDLDAAYRLVFNGGWTHSSNGATPNGTNGYADTKLVPSSVFSSINNVHLSHYSRTQNSAISAHDIGVDIGLDALNVSQYFAGVSNKLFMNGQFPINSAEFNQTNTLGLSVGSATSSTLRKLYFNGTLLNTDTNTQNTTLPSGAIYLGSGRNGTTSPYVAAYFSNRQVALSTIGNGLTDTEAANLYSRVQTYQQALNRAVI
jgi:hypothetical protein